MKNGWELFDCGLGEVKWVKKTRSLSIVEVRCIDFVEMSMLGSYFLLFTKKYVAAPPTTAASVANIKLPIRY